jgi:hypothetical protein
LRRVLQSESAVLPAWLADDSWLPESFSLVPPSPPVETAGERSFRLREEFRKQFPGRFVEFAGVCEKESASYLDVVGLTQIEPHGPPKAAIPDVDWTADFTFEEFKKSTRGNRGTLHKLPKPVVDEASGEYVLGDGRGKNQAQAKKLADLGLVRKAQRLAWCERLARCGHCQSCGREFKKTFDCGLRFCQNCARKNFDRLFAKYVHLDSAIPEELKCRPGYGWHILDFSFRHYGRYPTRPELKRAGQVICAVVGKAVNMELRRQGKVAKIVVQTKRGPRLRKPFGYLRVGEFGFDNTNYHIHGAYFGPALSEAMLRKLFYKETKHQSHRVVFKTATNGFESVLAHALKYTEKLAASTPQALAELEFTFEGTRRVQTMGIFYDVKLPEDASCSPQCPCGGSIEFVSGWEPAEGLAHLPELEKCPMPAGAISMPRMGAGP